MGPRRAAGPPRGRPRRTPRPFGDARLGVLYSGSFGRAHSFTELLALARRLRSSGIHLAFSVRGNREAELRAAVTPDDTNVSFAPFVSEGDLSRRLGAADVHAVSLRSEWTGTFVPSKFQAALAAGRPVLFAGSPDAALARWVAEFGVGFTLTPEPASVESTAAALLALAEDPRALAALRLRCHAAYAPEVLERIDGKPMEFSAVRTDRLEDGSLVEARHRHSVEPARTPLDSVAFSQILRAQEKEKARHFRAGLGQRVKSLVGLGTR